jgi:hypothetical protein
VPPHVAAGDGGEQDPAHRAHPLLPRQQLTAGGGGRATEGRREHNQTKTMRRGKEVRSL